MPLFQSIDGWFWFLHHKTLEFKWFAVIIQAIVLSVTIMVLKSGKCTIAHLLVIILGYSLQMSLALSEGRDIDGMKDKLVRTGHAEFARVAAGNISMTDTATKYESMLWASRLGGYSKTKPPGTLPASTAHS